MKKIGIDVGGTFTDFLLTDEEGNSQVYKVLTTPEDPSLAVIEGLKEMAQGRSLEDFIKEISLIVHGTTVTTNAILTGSGAKTGLLTTKGFRDALEMRRGIRDELYNNKVEAPKPLVPRYLRIPVEERINTEGNIIFLLNEEDIKKGIEKFQQEGVEAVAICFMHSYVNKKHEELASKIVTERFPGKYVSISSGLLPQIRFYHRVSTTVLNSYVGPILETYLTNLLKKLDYIGFEGVLLIMQSNGGVASPEMSRKMAASTLLSGPAAGPIAGIAYSSIQGYNNCITIDMGGTSFDAVLIKDKKPLVTTEGQVNRYPLALPMVDIHTIGAGGGSIGWIDEGGFLRMGPYSAGAKPGPACYDLGGIKPTCTDADLLLGYLNKDYFLGGKMKLNLLKAEKAVKEWIGDPLGLDVIKAAFGMFRLININMANGIRKISVERGLDPRDFPLIVAGGAGPIHAGMIALELEIPVIIIPKESSVFCAVGMLLSDLRHDFIRTYNVLLSKLDEKKWKSLFELMKYEGIKTLKAERIAEDRIDFVYSCDMRYIEQYHEVNVICSKEEIEGIDLDSIARKFHQNHDQLYGYSLEAEGTPIEIVNLRLSCIGKTSKPRFKESVYQERDPSRFLKGRRKVYLPERNDFEDVQVFDGMGMEYGSKVIGPAIIEQVNTTVFVPPEYNMICDRYGSILCMFEKN